MIVDHPEVSELIRQFEAIRQDAKAVADGLSAEEFTRLPAPDRWSVGQCLEHLNVTDRAMLPLMREAARTIQSRGHDVARPTRHGLLMGWLIRSMEPPVKHKIQTQPPFMPPADLDRERVMADFEALHVDLVALLESLRGWDLNGARILSPFVRVLRYKLGSALALTAAHDRRHLWQARQVRDALAQRTDAGLAG